MRVGAQDLTKIRSTSVQFRITRQPPRFKKRRELSRLTSDELLRFNTENPERLWTGVRQLDDAVGTIVAITQACETDENNGDIL